jgi:hypothetical protein
MLKNDNTRVHRKSGDIYKYNTLYFIFYNIFKIKKSNVMVNVNTPDDGNVVPKHVVEKW